MSKSRKKSLRDLFVNIHHVNVMLCNVNVDIFFVSQLNRSCLFETVLIKKYIKQVVYQST
jgi:hypothetical protein